MWFDLDCRGTKKAGQLRMPVGFSRFEPGATDEKGPSNNAGWRAWNRGSLLLPFQNPTIRFISLVLPTLTPDYSVRLCLSIPSNKVAEDMAAITTTAPNQTGVLLQSSHEPLISQLPAC